VWLKFAPAKRQRVKEATFDLGELEPTSVTARGMRIAAKPVSHVKWLREERKPAKAAPPKPRRSGGAKGEQTALF
jgi:hypothetical protein